MPDEMMTFTGISDSHFHTLAMQEKGIDTSQVYAFLFANGFEGGIDIGCSAFDLEKRLEQIRDFPLILPAAAMGPWEAGSSDDEALDDGDFICRPKSMKQIDEELNILKDKIISNKIRFIGEIGLDYYWKYGTVEKQKHIFTSQMDLAQELGLPVMIHNREADEDVSEIIRSHNVQKGIIHCFSGDAELMKTALDKGYYISFAGNLTFKNAHILQKRITEVPLDRLLLETDAPYLTPVPFRGTVNTPEKVACTYDFAAGLLGIDKLEFRQRILSNYRTFISEQS